MDENHPSINTSRYPLQRMFGWILFGVGLTVFLVRFQHAGPYAFPRGGNLLGGLLALGFGGFLALAPRANIWLKRGVLLASPVVLFFALYATLAEVEEVIVLEAETLAGDRNDLRLWVVDESGAAWVTMPEQKATTHALDGARISMRRNGERSCVQLTRQDDRETVNRIHRLRHERYAVQRLATQVGIFGRDADPTTITLRIDPCEAGDPSEASGRASAHPSR